MKRAQGLILIVAGIVAFGVMHRNFRQAEASTTWPSVDGIVVQSQETSRPGKKPGRPSSRWADIQYTYRVSETEYRGDQISVGNLRKGGSVALLLRRYPVGAQVAVHYNPSDPSEAVLEPGVPGGARWLYFGPAVLCVIGAYRTLVPARSARR